MYFTMPLKKRRLPTVLLGGSDSAQFFNDAHVITGLPIVVNTREFGVIPRFKHRRNLNKETS